MTKLQKVKHPSTITKTFIDALSSSFKYAACNPKTSVFSPTIFSLSLQYKVFTEPVTSASLINKSTCGTIFCLYGKVILIPVSSFFLISFTIFGIWFSLT